MYHIILNSHVVFKGSLASCNRYLESLSQRDADDAFIVSSKYKHSN